MPFGPGRDALRTVRNLVLRHAKAAGLDGTATEHLTLAANELATNSLRHGGGRGRIRLWRVDHTLVCEVSDAGELPAQPLLGRLRPTLDQIGGRGLWLANQLCDLVQIRTSARGTTIRLHMAV